MKTQDIIIAHPKTAEQVNVIKAFMEALKIKFEISKKEKSPYSAEFIAKIEKSKNEFEKGEFTRVEEKDLESLLGLE